MIRTVTCRNLEGVTEREITAYFRERGVGLAVERRYEPKVVEKAKAALKEFFARHGQPGVQIEAEVLPMPPRSVEVRFTIKR